MKKIEILVLSIYTIINLKIMWPIISVGGFFFLTDGSFNGAVTIFISLFLNTVLILYWIKDNYGKSKTI